jgi:hypothetical protein
VARLLLLTGRRTNLAGEKNMTEIAILVMQVTCGLALIAGCVLALMELARQTAPHARNHKLDELSFSSANDFEIDYRRVLAFAKLPVRR